MDGFDFKKFSYYYYGLLNKREKESYKKMLLAILELQTTVSLSYSLSLDELAKVSEFICHDRPDVFWYFGEYKYTCSDDKVDKVFFTYRMSSAEVETTKNKMADSTFFKQLDILIEGKNTPFEKALATFESIVEYADFDAEVLNKDWKINNYAYNIDGLILYRKGVCAGYSKLFQYFMNRHNIYCTYVVGKTSTGRHAWNLINLDGKYYYIDVSAGDPDISKWSIKPVGYICYDRFCVTTKEFMKLHNVVLENKMPSCTGTRYNYYRYFNMITDVYSNRDVALRMIDAYKKRKCNVVIIYSDKNTYLNAKRELFDNGKIHDVYRKVKWSIPGFDSAKVTYRVQDEINKIELFF
jgi:hypothetical protein